MASAQTVGTLLYNGDPANRIDVVVVSEGYTSTEMAKFAADAQSFVNRFMGVEIYQDYSNYFNVRTVAVASNQSGADHPELTPPVYVDTAFGATYDCEGIVRLICVDATRVHAVVDPLLPANQRDYIFVLVNDSTYGGSGGGIPVSSTNVQSVEIMLHEFGHTHGLLADEYAFQPPPCNLTEPTAANSTTQTVRAYIKWNAWIDANTAIPTLTTTPGVPGLYEGSDYCPAGMYRPTYNSRMRALGFPYEQVNDEQMVRRFYNFVSPIDAFSPSNSTLSVSKGGKQGFSVTPLVPVQHSLTVTWSVDATQVAIGPSYMLDTTGLSTGAHTVAAVVHDGTTYVRTDPANLLTDTQTWQLNVTPTQQTTAVTIQTSPSGLQFSVDGGAAQVAPQTLSLSQGSHTIAVVTTQAASAGTRCVFTGWNDSGAALHSISVGGSASTYTATFKTQYQLTTAASPVAGGVVTPASGGFYDSGTIVPVNSTSNSGYSFTSWTASVANPNSASTTVTMAAPETATASFTSIPFFAGSVNGGGGTLYLQFPNGNIFGYYGFLGGGWTYHVDLGYEYAAPGNGPEVYLWDLASGHWWYTNSSTFPYLYDFTWNVWLYYFPDTKNGGHYTTNPRYFANMTTGQIFKM